VDEEAAPSERPSPKRTYSSKTREVQQEAPEDLLRSQWRLPLKEEQALPLHLLNLDGLKGGESP